MDDMFRDILASVILGFFLGLLANFHLIKYDKEDFFKNMLKTLLAFVVIGFIIHLLGGFGSSSNNGWTNMPGRLNDFK